MEDTLDGRLLAEEGWSSRFGEDLASLEGRVDCEEESFIRDGLRETEDVGWEGVGLEDFFEDSDEDE